MDRGLKSIDMATTLCIYSALHHNTITLNDNLDIISSINLGRGAGHTHAVKSFVYDNPNINFCIIGMSRHGFDFVYKNMKNAYHCNSNISAIKFGYIIFENRSTFTGSVKGFIDANLTHLYINNPRVMGVG